MRVLLLAHFFPPMGGAGVQRALKFSRYLVEQGVEVTVLAAEDPDYLSDPTLLAELPAAVQVHRVRHRTLLQRVLQWRAAWARRRPALAVPPVPAAATAGAAAGPVTRWRDRLLGLYASLHWPDDKSGWARKAFGPGRRLLAEQRFDLILSTSPPVSSHALAARLSAHSGVPWVADWRDLWTDNTAYMSPPWRRALDRRLEDRWLNGACGVIAVTPSTRRLLAARVHSGVPVAFIPNGYDENDFAAAPPRVPPADECCLVHVGTFHGSRSPAPVLQAAEALLARSAQARARLKLRFVGTVGQRHQALLAEFGQRHPGVLQVTGYVTHAQAVAEMQGADALWLHIGGGREAACELPGKVFEYLRSRRPVLLVGPVGGDAHELLRAHSASRAFEEEDVPGLTDALQALVESGFGTAPVDSDPRCFERAHLTTTLREFMARCLSLHAERRHG